MSNCDGECYLCTGDSCRRDPKEELVTNHTLPTDPQERKNIPFARGCLDYFPAALAAVAKLSKAGNDKHNPGEELHHARGKSTDHADCILRHLVDRGTIDPEDGVPHSVKVAWRALALLQEELEATGSPLARGARLPVPEYPIETSRFGRKFRRTGEKRVAKAGDWYINPYYPVSPPLIATSPVDCVNYVVEIVELV